MKEYLQILDQLEVNLTQGSMLLVNIILAFVMFGVALGIKLDTFKDVVRNPKSVLTGLFLQWVALPAATCLLVIILNPVITPMVAIGMILVACCPGGNISNFITSLSKGNAELSVFMTAITTLFATLITPFNFWLWGTLYCRFAEAKHEIPNLDIPFMDMLMQIVLILGVPIVLGVIVSRYLPTLAKRLAKPAQVLSILLFLCMVVVSVSQVLSSFPSDHAGHSVYMCLLVALVIVILHNATALYTGYSGSTLMKLPRIDRRSITIEVGIQNSGLGLALLLNDKIFDPQIWSHNGGMVVIVALWGVWHIISGLSIATIFRRKPLCE